MYLENLIFVWKILYSNLTVLHVQTIRNDLHTYLILHWQKKHKGGIVFSYGEETMGLDGETRMLSNTDRLFKRSLG